MKKGDFKKYSTNELKKIVYKRKFEDTEVLSKLEKLLRKKRKTLFELPKPGSSVILLVSGGLDSIVTWDILLRKHKLKVFPLFLNKGEKRKTREERAVSFFSRYFQTRFPRQFISPYKHTAFIPQKEVIDELQTPFSSLEMKNSEFPEGTTANIFLGSPGIVPFYAMTFARYLELKEKIKIRTIFSSVMAGDGYVCPSQSLTSLRSINLAMCIFTSDYSWQFTSFAIETELGHNLKKEDYVRYAQDHGLPIENTWSCYNGKRFHCGKCLACYARKEAFAGAAVEDKTQYLKEVYDLASLLKKIVSKIK